VVAKRIEFLSIKRHPIKCNGVIDWRALELADSNSYKTLGRSNIHRGGLGTFGHGLVEMWNEQGSEPPPGQPHRNLDSIKTTAYPSESTPNV